MHMAKFLRDSNFEARACIYQFSSTFVSLHLFSATYVRSLRFPPSINYVCLML